MTSLALRLHDPTPGYGYAAYLVCQSRIVAGGLNGSQHISEVAFRSKRREEGFMFSALRPDLLASSPTANKPAGLAQICWEQSTGEERMESPAFPNSWPGIYLSGLVWQFAEATLSQQHAAHWNRGVGPTTEASPLSASKLRAHCLSCVNNLGNVSLLVLRASYFSCANKLESHFWKKHIETP